MGMAAMIDRIAWGLLMVCVLASAGMARAEPEAVARGRRFAELVCSACHVVSGNKAEVPVLRDPGPPLAEIAERPTTTEASLRAFLVSHRPAMGPAGRMPNPQLVDYQIDEVVAYILSLRERR